MAAVTKLSLSEGLGVHDTGRADGAIAARSNSSGSSISPEPQVQRHQRLVLRNPWLPASTCPASGVIFCLGFVLGAFLSFTRTAGKGKLWAVRGCLASPSAACSARLLRSGAAAQVEPGGVPVSPGLPSQQSCLHPLGSPQGRGFSFRHGSGLARLWLRRPGGIRRDHWLCKSRQCSITSCWPFLWEFGWTGCLSGLTESKQHLGFSDYIWSIDCCHGNKILPLQKIHACRANCWCQFTNGWKISTEDVGKAPGKVTVHFTS